MTVVASVRSFDLLTQQYLGTLPLSGITFDRKIPPDVGTLRGNLNLATAFGAQSEAGFVPGLSAIGGDALALARLQLLLRAARPSSLLIVDVGGQPVWWGSAITSDYDSDTGEIALGGEELFCHLRDYPLRQDLNYGNNGIGLKDQTSEIAKGLVDWMQAQDQWTNLQINTMLTGAGGFITPSGVLRERHYVGTDRKYVGELLVELAHVSDGFQFLIDCTYSSTRRPQLFFRTGFPRLGRRYDAANPDGTPQFSFNKDLPNADILSYRWPENFAHTAQLVDAVSHNTDGTTTIGTSNPNLALRDANLPERVAVVNFDGTSDITALQGHANDEAQKRAVLTSIPTFKVRMQDFFGYVGMGDDLRILLQDWRFPSRISGVWRVMGFSCDIDQETVTPLLDVT